ncbi:hypothetical protein PP459_gp214 [Streptomyces phage Wakanda]|uniref:Uncharacterized protein n=1 Tax=Streptomyces phage Wakanda TaxID=2713267 RepID=A0A6G8R1E1_9CAUD|nr:hypothetical protein PP459_gp214 [Streptomyces phage Wakanda]QIN94020.1 hypothetical protein SEA_WAKANDA_27 [Streptomyces phage Wakanda]
MPTRLYLPASGTAAVSPAYSSAWNITSVAERRSCSTTKTNTALTWSALVTETDATVKNALSAQFVSSETFPTARTVGSGTVSTVMRTYMDTTNSQGFLQLVIRVVSGDGATVRGTLYAGATQNTHSSTVGDQNQVSDQLSSTRIWNAIPLSPVSVQAGDRIVVEVGWRTTNTLSSARAHRFNFGDPTATSDYALTAGLTTSLTPWVEFSEDMFAAAPAPTWWEWNGSALVPLTLDGEWNGSSIVPLTISEVT